MNILDMSVGQEAVVQDVKASSAIRQRLFDMGVLPHSRVCKERSALLGDPVWIKVNNIELALRRNEAESVMVEI